MQEPLGTNVSATEKVLIKPVAEHFDESADLCAINWFNLKTPPGRGAYITWATTSF